MVKLYDFHRSGNGYKIRLTAHQLEIPHEVIEIDIRKGEHKDPVFLAKNPHGRVPFLITDDGEGLPESNAIVYYLARDSELFPKTKLEQAYCLGWMFFEQNNIEVNIANTRYFMTVIGKADQYKDEIKVRHEPGREALGRMEQHLKDHDFFVGNRYTIADISLYAYSHLANEGGWNLDEFPAVKAWHARVRAQPRHIPM